MSTDAHGSVVQYSTITLGGIDVCFTEDLDGGGARYGQDYIGFVEQNLGSRARTFEWCAGPGFIGFSLLGHGLTDTLCLADVNPAAVDACHETVRRNGLEGRVDVYLSDGLDAIPATERWNLVVGNPPHSGTAEVRSEIKRPLAIYQDVDWLIHENFYASVGAHLAPDAQIVIQENLRFSSAETFAAMLAGNGLQLVDSPVCKTPEGNTLYFYMWSVANREVA